VIMEGIDETDFRQSSFRENLLEHMFISEVLQGLGEAQTVIEVLHSEVDDSGYDLVACERTSHEARATQELPRGIENKRAEGQHAFSREAKRVRRLDVLPGGSRRRQTAAPV